MLNWTKLVIFLHYLGGVLSVVLGLVLLVFGFGVIFIGAGLSLLVMGTVIHILLALYEQSRRQTEFLRIIRKEFLHARGEVLTDDGDRPEAEGPRETFSRKVWRIFSEGI